MKRIISRMFNSLPKRLVAGSLASVLLAVPVAAVLAANTVTIAATTGVANVTAGDTTYSSAIDATYDQVVKVEVIYTNTEAASSNLVANNLNIKINVPTTAGANQEITTTTTGSNTNTVNGQVGVTLSDPTSYLQYIPGSAVAKLTAPNGTISETAVSDDVVLGSGYNVANGDPCQSASVTILARVMVPGVKIVKQSEVLGQSNAWSNDNTANPGDTLKYLITYQNIGNTEENNVIIGDNLPPGMAIVPNTTEIYNNSFPNGVSAGTNNVVSGGINIGNYGPSAGGYVEFEVTVPQASDLTCGVNEFRNVGVAQPAGMDQYYNTAITDVTKTCAAPVAATYSCNAVNITQTGNAIVASVNTTANNGATLKSVTYDFGDGSTPFTTNASSANYTYAAVSTNTTRVVTATATFDVNGTDETANTTDCTKTVSLVAPVTPVTPSAPTSTPTALTNTGPGDVIGLFAATTIAGAFLHRLFKNRQLARNNQ